MFTLSFFIVLLLIVAWHLSRKFYKRAPPDSLPGCIKLSDFYRQDISNVWDRCWSHLKSSVVTVKVGRTNLMVVNDWNLISTYDNKSNLDLFYSNAPRSLRRKWCGLLISDSTLPQRSQLRSLILHAFDGLPNSSYMAIGHLSCDPRSVGRYLPKQPLLDQPALDKWLWFVLSEFLLFNSNAFDFTEKEYIAKEELVNTFISHVLSLQAFHIDGRVRKSCVSAVGVADQPPLTVGKLLPGLEQIFNPLIRFTNERLIAYDGCVGFPNSLLVQLICAHYQLQKDGHLLEPLILNYFSHCLSEIALILHWTLSHHLRLLFAALVQRPTWQQRLENEALASFNANCVPKNGSQMMGQPPMNLLLQQTNSLVWVKAIVNESMRICGPGWPFGCLRRAIRDGRLEEYDYAEGEHILFNQPAYLMDDSLWSKDLGCKKVSEKNISESRLTVEGDPRVFNPWRFLDFTSAVSNVPRLWLPKHWARFMLTGYTVSIPNDCIYRLLTSIVLHLFRTGRRICPKDKADHDMDHLESPLSLDLILPVFEQK